MRIMAKRLRYAIELFTPCWSETLASFAKEIAKMQSSLGELHDCDDWIAEIGATLQRTEPDGRLGAKTPFNKKTRHTSSTGEIKIDGGLAAQKRGAAIWLLDYFVNKRAQHFRDALARWHEWEMTGFRASLTAALNNETPAVEFTQAALTPAEAVADDLKSHQNP